jgi:hypothetical protein
MRENPTVKIACEDQTVFAPDYLKGAEMHFGKSADYGRRKHF